MIVRALYVSYDGVLDPIGRSQVLAYMRRIAAAGVSFTLISFEKSRQLADRPVMHKLQTELSAQGIRWIPLRYHKSPRLLATLWDIGTGVLTALWASRAGKFAIVHGRSCVGSLMAWLVRRAWSARFIYDVRGVWSEELIANGRLRRGLVYRIIHACESRMLRTADHVVVLTEAAKPFIEEWSGRALQHVTAIPCCVDTSFHPAIGGRDRMRAALGVTDRSVVMYAGSLDHWYDVEAMVACVAIWHAEQSDVHFVVVTASATDALWSAVRAIGLPESSVTVTQASHDRMPDMMSAADIGLFLIHTPPAVAGVSPVKLAEYIQCGVPVVSNQGIGDMDIWFAEYPVGVLLEELTDTAYRHAMTRVQAMRRDQLALQQASEGLLANVLSIDIAVARYIRVYQQLLGVQLSHVTASSTAMEFTCR